MEEYEIKSLYFDSVAHVIKFLEAYGYDITKRAPEIAPCPFCGNGCFITDVDDGYQILCSECEYKSRIFYYSGLLKDNVKKNAIKKHNLIAGKGK